MAVMGGCVRCHNPNAEANEYSMAKGKRMFCDPCAVVTHQTPGYELTPEPASEPEASEDAPAAATASEPEASEDAPAAEAASEEPRRRGGKKEE